MNTTLENEDWEEPDEEEDEEEDLGFDDDL